MFLQVDVILSLVMMKSSKCVIKIMQIDELLGERNTIHAAYTMNPGLKRSSSSSKVKNSSKGVKSGEEEENSRDEKRDKDKDKDKEKEKERIRDRLRKKKWFNIHVKMDRKKPC